jgi:hypothetical protein
MDVGTALAATACPKKHRYISARPGDQPVDRRHAPQVRDLPRTGAEGIVTDMIERLRTSLFALHALTPRELSDSSQEKLRGDCADALRLELDCPQQALTDAQRQPLARLRELLDEPEVPADVLAKAVHEAWSVVVRQPIVGYHLEDVGHWVAELACGHGQHVRHDPPWQVRPWVTTPEGRAKFLGFELECLKCERGEPTA